MNIKNESSKLMFKVSLLAISLFIMMSAVISPALPLIERAFPNIARVNVELLTTIPNLGQIIGLILNPFLVRKIGKKRVIILGLAIIGITGTLPVIINNFWLIFFLRILLGVGVGIYNSLAVSLLMSIYHNNDVELNQMLGFQNIMNDIGYIVSSLLICYLVTLSWHAVFWVYIFAIPILFMFQKFVKVPKVQHTHNKEHFSLTNFKGKFNSTIIIISIITLLIYIFYMALAYKLPAFIIKFHLGNESTASFMLAVIAIMGIPCGMSFNWLYNRLNKWIWPICLLLNATGFFLISISRDFGILVVGCVILGLGFGLVMPYIFKWISNSAPAKWENLDTTLCLVMMDGGCVASPYVISLITKNSESALLSSAIFFGILMIIEIIAIIIQKYSTKKASV